MFHSQPSLTAVTIVTRWMHWEVANLLTIRMRGRLLLEFPSIYATCLLGIILVCQNRFVFEIFYFKDLELLARGFVFEPVRMRSFFTSRAASMSSFDFFRHCLSIFFGFVTFRKFFNVSKGPTCIFFVKKA